MIPNIKTFVIIDIFVIRNILKMYVTRAKTILSKVIKNINFFIMLKSVYLELSVLVTKQGRLSFSSKINLNNIL